MNRFLFCAAFLAPLSAVAQAPVPQGGEFLLSETTVGDQRSAVVASDAGGSLFIAWESSEPSTSSTDVYARRFTAAGLPASPSFRVNTTTVGLQVEPSVALDDTGNAVVVWSSQEPDSGNFDVFARRYSASGDTLGSEFRVNTFTDGTQGIPAVAMNAAGEFVIVWQGTGPDGDGGEGIAPFGIFARFYDAEGAAFGGAFRVTADLDTTVTEPGGEQPAVTLDPAGNALVVWTAYTRDDPGDNIVARRFTAAGDPIGAGFRVNATLSGSQRSPAVAMAPDGRVVVAWTSLPQDGSNRGVYVQRFDAAGGPAGPETRVNTFTAGSQDHAAVAVDDAGGHVIVWQSGTKFRDGPDGDESAVRAQAYAADGTARGSEFGVNTTTAGQQFMPAIAIDGDGDAVVAWTGSVPGESDFGVYAQQYRTGPVPGEHGAPDAAGLVAAPSPAGPSGVTLRYTLAATRHVRLTVADALGRVVAVFADGEQAAGEHTRRLETSQLAPGVYVVRLDAGPETALRRVTVIR